MTIQRILITGAAGFIGANLVHYWLRQHPKDRIVALDALTYAGNQSSLAPLEDVPNFRFVYGDIREQDMVEELLREEKIDAIFHLAAESHVDRSIDGPDAFIFTNVVGTHVLLKAARKVWLMERGGRGRQVRFHHVSTDEVFGSLQPGDPAFTENSLYAPNSPYSATKAASDHLVRAYHHTYGLPVTTSNCSNNYGPYQFPEKLIPLMIVNALQGRLLPIYGTGTNIRDWIHVEDHCRGLEMVLHQGRPGETYNLGGDNQWSNLDLVKLLCGLLDEAFRELPELKERYPDCPAAQGEPCAALIAFVKDRPGHDQRYAMNIRKAQRELGYRPQLPFVEGIRQTLWWYLDHPDWWQAVIDGSYQDWVKHHYRMVNKNQESV